MALNETAMMRGVIYSGPYQINVTDLPTPSVLQENDAVVRITTSAICGSDLHVYHGLQEGETPWAMGHEALGYISDLGSAVSGLSVGDYVVIPDSISVPGHKTPSVTPKSDANGGTYGFGDRTLGGLQSEYARVPFADANLIPIPLTHKTTNASIEQDYLTVADIFATGWTALDFSGFRAGDSVAVFGAGPVGLLAAYSAQLRGASRVYVVDRVPMRLDRAAALGAVPINFGVSDPVAQILRHEPRGVARAVDCVGGEAVNINGQVQSDVVVHNMMRVVAEGGGLGQVGVYYDVDLGALSGNISFPVANFFGKGLTFRSGGVSPRDVAPELVRMIRTGRASPGFVASKTISVEDAPEYYDKFDRHEEIKVYIRFP